jgi:hypothetical protein
MQQVLRGTCEENRAEDGEAEQDAGSHELGNLPVVARRAVRDYPASVSRRSLEFQRKVFGGHRFEETAGVAELTGRYDTAPMGRLGEEALCGFDR